MIDLSVAIRQSLVFKVGNEAENCIFMIMKESVNRKGHDCKISNEHAEDHKSQFRFGKTTIEITD